MKGDSLKYRLDLYINQGVYLRKKLNNIYMYTCTLPVFTCKVMHLNVIKKNLHKCINGNIHKCNAWADL